MLLTLWNWYGQMIKWYVSILSSNSCSFSSKRELKIENNLSRAAEIDRHASKHMACTYSLIYTQLHALIPRKRARTHQAFLARDFHGPQRNTRHFPASESKSQNVQLLHHLKIKRNARFQMKMNKFTPLEKKVEIF